MAKNRKETPKKLTKIIYFDESSVTDYIQIIEGGSLSYALGIVRVIGISVEIR